jgi:predicted ester cyclase
MRDDIKQRFAVLMEEVFNRGNYDLADDYVASNFYNHEAPDRPGPEGFKATARWLRSVFPDYRAELHEILTDDPYVVGRLTVSGTHRGEFMGVAGTGRTFSSRTTSWLSTGPAATISVR